ncbi:MAG TPA: ankyrin repeat domain-containing protein, partial [Candidatus Berkiella sp.]|nr:ankyrin repeat domain-containing protein [Candidatus Berkiella sp.]
KNPSIKDNVLGQCWAWRSQSGAIVFDSIEVSKSIMHDEAQKKMVKDFYQHLGKTLIEEKHTTKVAFSATSGISDTIGIVTSMLIPKEHFIDYTGYCDSSRQRVIYDKEKPYCSHDTNSQEVKDFITNILKDETIPLVKNKAFVEMINWALIEGRQDIVDYIKLTTHASQKEELTVLLNTIEIFLIGALTEEELAQLIKDNQLPIDIKNKYGETPLLMAASRGHTDICLALIENGADVNAQDKDGVTPLYIAARKGHTDTCVALIKKGADVNATNHYHHETSLWIAAACGLIDVC